MCALGPRRRKRPYHVSTASPATIDDELRAAGGGDQAAFGRFYDQTAALVHGIVVNLVRGPAIAEEVTQEIYVELWRLAPRFDPALGSARAWAATIARRRAIDRIRSEQSARRRDDAAANDGIPAFDSVSETVADDLERSRVRQALDQLTDTQREAITLAYYGGHTYREVASLLDVPEGTVKTRIRDGLLRLRDHFGATT